MRAAPATIGGMPRSVKRARLRQSLTSSRSPCTTCSAIAVWPSLKVVKSWARAVGRLLLRGMIFSTSPPMVSRPSDSGFTSSSSRPPSPRAVAGQLVGLDRRAQRHRLVGVDAGAGFTAEQGRHRARAPPACAWRRPPAPRRRPRPASGRRRAARGAPAPACARPGRASGRRTGRAVDGQRLAAAVAARAAHVTRSRSLSAFLGAAGGGMQRGDVGRPQPPPLAAANQAARRWSKSSPPSAGSPLVAITSNTPRVRRRMRHVEGAAAQVVDHEDAFAGAVQPVGHRRGGGFVEQPQHGRPACALRRPWWPGAGRRRSRPAR
jgi:hypothetical protein